jgi:hypothetical protein
MKTIKKQNKDELVALALRQYAQFLLDHKDTVTMEEGRTLDRALRSCKGITDIDNVWLLWKYYGEPLGWITEEELKYDWKMGYYYPKKV